MQAMIVKETNDLPVGKEMRLCRIFLLSEAAAGKTVGTPAAEKKKSSMLPMVVTDAAVPAEKPHQCL